MRQLDGEVQLLAVLAEKREDLAADFDRPLAPRKILGCPWIFEGECSERPDGRTQVVLCPPPLGYDDDRGIGRVSGSTQCRRASSLPIRSRVQGREGRV